MSRFHSWNACEILRIVLSNEKSKEILLLTPFEYQNDSEHRGCSICKYYKLLTVLAFNRVEFFQYLYESTHEHGPSKRKWSYPCRNDENFVRLDFGMFAGSKGIYAFNVKLYLCSSPNFFFKKKNSINDTHKRK